MHLPINPPVAPMLAKPVNQIPDGPYSFEPKWDGFRSIVFADGGEVEFGSRNERPMTRYFPELVAAVTEQFPRRCVIDGEIVVPGSDGRRLDFEALLQRIHPAVSRVTLLASQTPGPLHRVRPARPRRRRLHRAAVRAAPGGAGRGPLGRDRAPPPDPRVHRPRPGAAVAPAVRGAGLDGIIAKPLAGTYEPDRRVMFKVKHERTADCVVAGYRTHKSGPDAIGSLLLGLYRDTGDLASVGVIGAFPMARRRELFAELQPLVTTFDDHPWNWARQEEGTRTPRAAEHSRWNAAKDLSFTPLRPERVVEVRYDHMEGPRFRHTAQFVRWRPDRDPRSCTYDQLEEPVSFDLAEILTGPAA